VNGGAGWIISRVLEKTAGKVGLRILKLQGLKVIGATSNDQLDLFEQKR
jgi:hypothetical protein